VDANADADAVVAPPLSGKAPLGAGRCGNGVGRVLEHDEERVTVGLDLDPGMVVPARPKELVVPFEHRPKARPKRLEHPRRPLDVREHEGDDSSWERFCSDGAPRWFRSRSLAPGLVRVGDPPIPDAPGARAVIAAHPLAHSADLDDVGVEGFSDRRDF
jgi:hypothetical protein